MCICGIQGWGKCDGMKIELAHLGAPFMLKQEKEGSLESEPLALDFDSGGRLVRFELKT